MYSAERWVLGGLYVRIVIQQGHVLIFDTFIPWNLSVSITSLHVITQGIRHRLSERETFEPDSLFFVRIVDTLYVC